jgi:hypothetical protein
MDQPSSMIKTIPLTQGKSAIVDDDVFDAIGKYKWFAHKNKYSAYYAQRSVTLQGKKNQSTDYLHWYVVGKPLNGLVVDHINGDTLDNRRENLRIVSKRGNSLNSKVHRNGKPIGARFMKGKNRWCSNIYINGRTKYIGCFKTAEEASNNYKRELLKVA